MPWRICRMCDQQHPQWSGGKVCFVCRGELVKLQEHPLTVGPFLERERLHLAWLHDPARGDWHNADDGTYYEPQRLSRLIALCQKRIKTMELLAALAPLRNKPRRS